MGNAQTRIKTSDNANTDMDLHPSKYCCEGKWIDPTVKQELQKEVAELERLLEEDKDWNLYSNEQTWNLVNPSLYSFIFGITPVVNYMDQRNEPIANWIGLEHTRDDDMDQRNESIANWIGLEHTIDDDWESESQTVPFQWLPSEFLVDENGKVTIQSYINNLHPYRFRNLYKSIATIFQQFVPQFEECLSKTSGKTITLKGRTLQVIVKISENVLTPERPYFDSGKMHTVLFLSFYFVFFDFVTSFQ